MGFDYVAPVVLGCCAIASVPWVILTHEVLDGAKTALQAKYALDRIALGEEITLKHHWPINDARMDPYAGIFMRLMGGKMAIYEAVRAGREARKSLDSLEV